MHCVEHGITTKNFPPNMTDVLQPMYMVVNGPVKAGIRQSRVEALFDYFQTWKIERLQHLTSSTSVLPSFALPKPLQAGGLLTTFKVLRENLSTAKFEASLARCYVEIGIKPREDGT